MSDHDEIVRLRSMIVALGDACEERERQWDAAYASMKLFAEQTPSVVAVDNDGPAQPLQGAVDPPVPWTTFVRTFGTPEAETQHVEVADGSLAPQIGFVGALNAEISASSTPLEGKDSDPVARESVPELVAAIPPPSSAPPTTSSTPLEGKDSDPDARKRDAAAAMESSDDAPARQQAASKRAKEDSASAPS